MNYGKKPTNSKKSESEDLNSTIKPLQSKAGMVRFTDGVRLKEGDKNDTKAKNTKNETRMSLPRSEFEDMNGFKKKKSRKRLKKILLCVVLVVLIIVTIGGFFVVKAYLSLNKVIQKNEGIAAEGLKNGEISVEKLKGEGDGRVNILILGTGDKGHAGEQLTDTIIVGSYDPKTRDVAMLGLPRDLYVPISGGGYSRINSAYYYGEERKKGGGAETTKQTVSKVLGIPIHYFVKVDFSAMKKGVDTVDGIDLVVDESLVDPEYPCEKNEGMQCGFSILKGPQHFNGSAALKYARCRKGNCGDDYGRAKRQQQVLVALKEKLTKLNILTNPAKISEIFTIIGEHIRTDLQLWEIERLASIAKDVDQTKITSKVFDNSSEGLVKNSMIDGASVVVPIAGIGNHSAIQAFVRKIFTDGYIKQEAAKIEIQNASGNSYKAKHVEELLKSYNYNVINSTVAATAKNTRILDSSSGSKPYTVKYLENRFGVKAEVVASQSGVTPTSDIVIIVGSNYKL